MAGIRLVFFTRPSRYWQQTANLRLKVFVDEQGVPATLELDACDYTAMHLCALDRSKVAGALRIVRNGGTAKIGRVAVAPAWRHKGLATRMMRRAMGWCRAKSVHDIVLASQISAVPFYRRLGFTEQGDVFMDAGIPHQGMRLRIATQTALDKPEHGTG